MWFFLQKNLKEKSRLFGILVALSGVAHGTACALFILLGRVISSQRVVSAMQRTVRVSMHAGGGIFPGSGKSSLVGKLNGKAGVSAVAQEIKKQDVLPGKDDPLKKVTQEPSPADTMQQSPKTEQLQPSKEVIAAIAEQKDAEQSSSKQNAHKQTPKEQKNTVQPVSSKAAQKISDKKAAPVPIKQEKKAMVAQKPQPVISEKEVKLFSSFTRPTRKKNDSTKEKNSAADKAENSSANGAQSVKEQSAATPDAPLFSTFKKKVKEEPAAQQESTQKTTSESIAKTSAPSSSISEASTTAQPQDAHKRASEQTSAQQNGLQGAAQQTAAQGLSGQQGTGSGGSGGIGGSSQEIVPFALEEGALSDHDIVREIWRHYRKPPGFEEHEPFVFTFEIKHKKAVSVGARGTEPLIIYTALKDAVLKATFEQSNTIKRVELVIT